MPNKASSSPYDTSHGGRTNVTQELRNEITESRHRDPTLVEVIVGLQNVQQAIREMIGMMAQQQQQQQNRDHQIDSRSDITMSLQNKEGIADNCQEQLK